MPVVLTYNFNTMSLIFYQAQTEGQQQVPTAPWSVVTTVLGVLTITTLVIGLIKFWPEYQKLRKEIRGNTRATFLTALVGQDQFRKDLTLLLGIISDIRGLDSDNEAGLQKLWADLRRSFFEPTISFFFIFQPELRGEIKNALDSEKIDEIEPRISKLFGV